MSVNKNSNPGYFPSYFDYHGIDPGSYYGVHYRNTVRRLNSYFLSYSYCSSPKKWDVYTLPIVSANNLELLPRRFLP